MVSKKPREEIKWNANAIKTILTNELYLGHLVQGKRTTVSYKNHKIKTKDKSEWIKILNTHEAIINEETFNKVQIAIKERTKPIKNTNRVHIFSGKVFCLECHHYMRKKNSSKHEYLVCNDCDNKKGIRYDDLANLVLDEINKKIKKFYDEKELEKLSFEKVNNSLQNKIKVLEKGLTDIQNNISKTRNYLKNIYEDKVNGVITLEQFKSLIANYNKDEDTLKNQIKSITKKINYYKMIPSKNYKEILTKYQKLYELNRVIIEEFIDKIYIGKFDNVTKNRNIQIKWNLQ